MSTVTKDTLAVGVIDHENGVGALGNLGEFVQWGDVSVHAEDTIGDNQLAAVIRPVLLHQLLQSFYITMRIGDDFGTAQPAPIDYAGMVEAVAEDHILFTDDRGHRG